MPHAPLSFRKTDGSVWVGCKDCRTTGKDLSDHPDLERLVMDLTDPRHATAAREALRDLPPCGTCEGKCIVKDKDALKLDPKEEARLIAENESVLKKRDEVQRKERGHTRYQSWVIEGRPLPDTELPMPKWMRTLCRLVKPILVRRWAY